MKQRAKANCKASLITYRRAIWKKRSAEKHMDYVVSKVFPTFGGQIYTHASFRTLVHKTMLFRDPTSPKH